jgi:hypothetical protein
VAPVTQATSRRRGQGEDSIYWDASKNRYVGAVSLGFNPAGTRIRKKVTRRTSTEVRDKLRELHKQVEGGPRPRRRYTVEDALEDWLAVGLYGLSARTVTLYRGTIAKALREELGSVRLTDLTPADVQKALTSIASRVATRTVQIAHNVLVRVIRQAERDDLVGRNVAALVKPPKGQRAGRPSKSLTLEQAVDLITAARGTRLEAYITVSLLTGLRTEEVRGAVLGSCRGLGRRPVGAGERGRVRSRATGGVRIAGRPGRGRYEDAEVSQDTGTAAAVRGCAAGAAGVASGGPARGGAAVTGSQPCFRVDRRDAAG